MLVSLSLSLKITCVRAPKPTNISSNLRLDEGYSLDLLILGHSSVVFASRLPWTHLDQHHLRCLGQKTTLLSICKPLF